MIAKEMKLMALVEGFQVSVYIHLINDGIVKTAGEYPWLFHLVGSLGWVMHYRNHIDFQLKFSIFG